MSGALVRPPDLSFRGQNARPWDPNLIVRAEGRGSLSVRIAQAIIEEIQRGRLAAGDSLPGTRDLAAISR